jgi:hypothetical protein
MSYNFLHSLVYFIILHHPKAPLKSLAFGTDRCRSRISAGGVPAVIDVRCWRNMSSASDSCAQQALYEQSLAKHSPLAKNTGHFVALAIIAITFQYYFANLYPTDADYSSSRSMKEHFGMSVEEVYANSELAAILLEKADLLATDSIIMDANDVCE